MYTNWFFITEQLWNNAFSYDQRKALWSECKIYVPPLITWTIDDLEIGTEIAFEEVVDGKLISCKWLKKLIKTNYKGIPTYIVDNHDHALYFRHQHINQFPTNEWAKPFKVIHIDQHSDRQPGTSVPGGVNVGNFITHALESRLIDECIQIRTETALHSTPKLDFQDYNYILDIDIDFRAWKNDIENDIKIIKNLINNVALITIATSPYFMDQKQAIEIIKKILIS